MMDTCSGCVYNIDNYCIMFDDVLGFEDCIFLNKDEGDDELKKQQKHFKNLVGGY